MSAGEQPQTAQEPEDEAARWARYYDAMVGRPPRETLLAALDRFDAEGAQIAHERFAVDLGCGEGRDTVEMLRRGWRVLAIDAQPEALARLRARPDLVHPERLETLVSRFEGAQWPAADLVNASYTLAFCPPPHFPALWQRIVNSVRPGGRFAGQLFGDRDAWAALPDRTHHARAEVERLLEPFAVEQLNEVEEDSQTALGMPKHWHVFHIIARKR